VRERIQPSDLSNVLSLFSASHDAVVFILWLVFAVDVLICTIEYNFFFWKKRLSTYVRKLQQSTDQNILIPLTKKKLFYFEKKSYCDAPCYQLFRSMVQTSCSCWAISFFRTYLYRTVSEFVAELSLYNAMLTRFLASCRFMIKLLACWSINHA